MLPWSDRQTGFLAEQLRYKGSLDIWVGGYDEWPCCGASIEVESVNVSTVMRVNNYNAG